MLDHPEFTQRVSRLHRHGMWIGAVRRAFGPIAEVPSEVSGSGPIETHPPHFLVALWQPLRPGEMLLPRWPSKAALVAPDERAAINDLLREVPHGERLWLSEHPFDWVLVADIVMLCEPGLAPWQFRGLHEFVQLERQTTLASIKANYGGSDEVFDKFRRIQPGRAQE